MDKRIVYRNPATGQLAIVTPVEPMLAHETEAAYLNRIGAQAALGFQVPMARVAVLDKSEFPGRRWRDAWEWNNGIELSLDKVKSIRAAELRDEAKAELVKANEAFMEALQAGRDASVEGAAANSLREFIADPVAKLPDFRTPEEADQFKLESRSR